MRKPCSFATLRESSALFAVGQTVGRVGMLDDVARQGEQRNGIGDDHELVEHVAQLPDKVIGHRGAEEDEDEREQRVNIGALLAEEVDHVDLAKQVPAQDRGECEEEQAHRDERVARLRAEHRAERALGKVRLVEGAAQRCRAAAGERAVARVERGDDDKGVERQDDEHVDEHADDGDSALLVRIFDVGERVGVGRGAHTGLVGEQAALRALGDGELDGVAEAAADDGLRLKGVAEDHGEGLGNVLDTDNEHDEAAEEEHRRHEGHDLFRHGRKALHAAEENERADDDQHDADAPRWDAERGLHRCADGVGLHHAAHETERQRDGDGEEAREELAEFAMKGRRDVVDRAALDRAVGFDDARLLRERRFRVDRGHAEKRDDPHPEHRARAAGEDRARDADDDAGADLSSNGGGERLKRAHSAAALLAVEGDAAEHAVPALLKAAYLDAARLDRVPDADAEQQNDQNVVAEVLVDLLDDGEKRALE